jgi:polyhydroxyalkanoate synthesis regulator phasin
METQNVMKELLYLSTGFAVISKHKAEQLIESLIANNEITREEGKVAIDKFVEKSTKLKSELQKKKEDLIDRFVEKTNLAREEISQLIDAVLDKPKQGKEQVELKYNDLVNAVSLSTSMAKHEVELLVKNSIKQVEDVWEKYETKSEDFVKDITKSIQEVQVTGNSWIAEAMEKSHDYKQELGEKLDTTLHTLLDKIHIASKEELSDLDRRVTGLEESR